MSTAFTQEGLFSNSESLRVGVHWLKLAPSYFGLLRWLGGKESSCHTGGTGDMSSIPGGDRLEEEMATHSSILVWKIPWIEETGGLQFMELQIRARLSY